MNVFSKAKETSSKKSSSSKKSDAILIEVEEDMATDMLELKSMAADAKSKKSLLDDIKKKANSYGFTKWLTQYVNNRKKPDAIKFHCKAEVIEENPASKLVEIAEVLSSLSDEKMTAAKERDELREILKKVKHVISTKKTVEREESYNFVIQDRAGKAVKEDTIQALSAIVNEEFSTEFTEKYTEEVVSYSFNSKFLDNEQVQEAISDAVSKLIKDGVLSEDDELILCDEKTVLKKGLIDKAGELTGYDRDKMEEFFLVLDTNAVHYVS